jgi:hypothetical protein
LSSNNKFLFLHSLGHQQPPEFLLQTGHSTWAVLHSSHSIRAANYSRLNFGNAAGTAIQVSGTTGKSRPEVDRRFAD